MSLEAYLARIEAQRADGDAMSYDLSPFFALGEADRTTALGRLMRYAEDGDAVAVATLGMTGDARAIPLLEALRERGAAVPQGPLGSALHMVRSAAQRSLFQIRGHTDDVTALAAEIRADNEFDRAMAAAALKFSVLPPLGDDRRRALASPLIADALLDPAKPPRHHAGRAAVAVLGLDAEALPRQHPIAVLLFQLSSGLVTQWQPAARELGALLRPGVPVPTYQPSSDPTLVTKFWDGLRPPVPRPEGWTPFRWDLLSGMGAHDRAWVETLVISRLGTADAFAPDAAVTLLGAAALPHLDAAEQMHAALTPFVTAVKAARKRVLSD